MMKKKPNLQKEITESMKRKRDIEQERVDAAHKANQEIYENATGQRKTVLENVKMSELYNADVAALMMQHIMKLLSYWRVLVEVT